MVVHVTDKDVDVVQTLARAVRVLSTSQVGARWFGDTERPELNAIRRLRRLEHAGYVRICRTPAHPLLPLARPVVDWTPVDPTPDLGHAAYILNRRWSSPPVLTTWVIATLRGRNLFGVAGRRPREVELTHDLHLSELFLRLRATSPAEAAAWEPEEELRMARAPPDERIPDAFIRTGLRPRIVEFGGAYKKPKLEKFHQYCAERSYAYELW